MSPIVSLIKHAASPALPPPHPRDALTGALGILFGLLFTHVVLWLLGGGDAGILAHPMLIAPFGASAVLIFCTPSSPLAQPWSVVAGNGIAAVLAVIVLHLGLPAVPTLILAAFAGVAAMSFARALHPPGGAVAVATVLGASADHMPGLSYIVVTVVLGSALLVAFGIGFHLLTGRLYPFRASPVAPPAPERRLLPPPRALALALDRLRLGEIMGVEDLSHLIETAEEVAVSQSAGLNAAGIMTPDAISVGPDADWRDLSALFVQHGFRSLPVVDEMGRFMGLIPVQAILRPGAQGLVARHLMQQVATQPVGASLVDMLPPLAQGHQPALPVVDADGRLAGVITRSDIVAALVHAMSHP